MTRENHLLILVLKLIVVKGDLHYNHFMFCPSSELFSKKILHFW